MREFFRGWKRKVGVATLALACVFAGAWLRSQNTIDLIFLNYGRSHATVVSGGGCLSLSPGHRLATEIRDSQLRVRSVLLFEDTENRPRITGRDFIYALSWTDFRFQTVPPLEKRQLIIAYWSIVIPLTFLSPYLLFSKHTRQRRSS